MTIDNCALVRERVLRFDAPGQFYVIHAVCRPNKDGICSLNGGTNNHQRKVRSWFLYSKEEFDKCLPSILRVCDANNARGYVLPQRRTVRGAMKAIAMEAVRNADATNINFNRFLETCICGDHADDFGDAPEEAEEIESTLGGKRHGGVPCADTSRKTWVIDLDCDSTAFVSAYGRVLDESEFEIAVRKVRDEIEPRVVAAKKDPNDIFIVPTLHGAHLVTPPFCPVANKKVGLGPIEPLWDADWLKTDAMTLFYYGGAKGGVA